MAIYRGPGGAGDATADAASEASLIKDLAVEVQADADAAAASATAAAGSASAASTSATNASNSASAAASSASSASSSASAASTSASNAATSATNAANSATAAQTAETNAETAETNAAASASAAASSASNAATSASNASTSATNASNSASAAATSATNASNSASAASTSATAAAGSATSASNSASAASTSAANAANSATAAATSATNAAASATSASNSASTATTQATNASNSATAAATSASNAATSESNAASSASAANTSASNAATSATNAANSATAAANSATLAASYTPSQTGNAGKYLTTNGTVTSWATVDALPSQTGNAGKYLSTNGTTASWQTINVNPALDDLSDVIITSPATGNVLRYNGTNWENSNNLGTRTVTEVTATAGQISFTPNGGYTVGFLDVFINGSKLTNTDFTATNGTTVTLTEAAQAGDIVRLEALGTFLTSSAVPLTGGNITGNLNVSGNLGVGTTSPSHKLHVAGSGSTYIQVTSTNAGSGTGFWTKNATNEYVIGAGAASGGSGLEFRDVTNSATRMLITSGGDLQFNSGYGSVATAYGCRAWVNFNGTGTVAIRASGNVSSITDNGTGDYTVNFSTAMPDANYCPSYSAAASQSIVDSNGAASHIAQPYSNTTSSHRVKTRYTFSNSNGAFTDFETINVAIFR